MTRVRVEGFTISLDGYGAGPSQDIRNPLGVGGTDLHQWLVPTRTFQRTLFGADGGTTGIDDDFAARGFKDVGSWILGRNMFGPIRGSWPDMNWKGGLSPHQPFQFMSGQEPRIGPNMFLPRIQAPTSLKPRAAKSSSIPVVPPSAPNRVRWNVRVGTNHWCRSVPPTPSGFLMS